MKYLNISKWICSEGGSLIAINKQVNHTWGGSSNTDFDSTFDFDDFVFQVNGFKDDTFFLGDEPLETAIITMDDGNPLIVRWRWANSIDDVLESLKLIELTNLKIIETAQIKLRAGDYYLFDAASKFVEVEDVFLQMELKQDVKFIETYSYENNDLELALYIHTFNP